MARAGRACGGRATSIPQPERPRLYGGFYSQDQVRDIVAYAAARHITIVPEIDMPGHASAAIAAYPQLGVSDAEHDLPRSVPADWGVYPHALQRRGVDVRVPRGRARRSARALSGRVHPRRRRRSGQGSVARIRRACRARMRELGVTDEHALQSYFMQRIEKYLNAHGRRLIGWDEILEGGLAPNATVMSWRGIDGAVAAAAAGHDAVLAPAPTLYFDNRPLDTRRSPGRGVVVERRGRLPLRSGAGGIERSAAQAHSRRAGEHLDRAHPHRGARAST